MIGLNWIAISFNAIGRRTKIMSKIILMSLISVFNYLYLKFLRGVCVCFNADNILRIDWWFSRYFSIWRKIANIIWNVSVYVCAFIARVNHSNSTFDLNFALNWLICICICICTLNIIIDTFIYLFKYWFWSLTISF